MNEIYLKVTEAAEKLHVHPNTVRRWIHQEKLPAYKMGRDWRIREADLHHYLAGQATEEPNQEGIGIDLLENAAHEFRGILNSILGYAQLILQRDDTCECASEVTVIQSEGQQALALINTLVDYAQAKAHLLTTQPTECHLPHLLEEIAGTARTHADQHTITFTYQPAKNLPTGIEIDASQLSQILINLLAHAVQLPATTEVHFVITSTRKTESCTKIQFEIRQITASENTTLAVNNSETLTPQSTLRLALSYQLVGLLDSELHSIPTASGTTYKFTIECPVAALLKQYTQITGYVGERQTILVADDREHNRQLLAEMLTQLGFDVLEAEDGQTAVNLAQTHRPALILMDLVMPKLTGFEAAAQLRAYSETHAIPVVAITASVFNNDEMQDKLQDFVAALTKPITQMQLTTLLQKHLQLKWITENQTPTRLPDRANLAKLREYLNRGDYIGIEDYADELAFSYPAFATQVKRMAKAFDTEGLKRICQQ